jgi:5S rRNA maturation endonuclease (ribonuclease M5)
MFDILNYIPGKRKTTARGWISFSAPCCHHRGHKPDKRMRGGIKQSDYNFSYHCFNCQFKCVFILGKPLSKNTKLFLEWCGLDESQITRINLESLQHKDLIDHLLPVPVEKVKVKFKTVPLPKAEVLDPSKPTHRKFARYLEDRKINYNDYQFLVTPNDKGRNSNRIIVPFTFEKRIVGNTSRFLDNIKPKYLNDQQPGYLFGYDFQKPDWTVCIVVEGIFDALSIDGCALGTSTISIEQQALLRKLKRPIIVVPDQDHSGMELCSLALELGYKVSLPEWGKDSSGKYIKDVNEATVRYGRLPTLLSILQCATNSKIKVDMARRKIDKRDR